MTMSLPDLRIGDPIRHEELTVFPLFHNGSQDVDYQLSDAALAGKSLLVAEVSESGSVPELLVENKAGLRVLFLEGEELVGAKQNRILNTSLLVPAHDRIKIPVSCVERGRWNYKSRHFGSSGSHSPSKLRRALKASVSRSIKEKRAHRSDQAELWKEVDCLHAAHGVSSGTAAMSDAFDAYQSRIAEFREKLKYVEGAFGFAVAISEKVVILDFFDKPSTCEKVWDRMLSGVVFDALEAEAGEKTASIKEVEEFIAAARDRPWEKAEAVGEGEEYRVESERGDHASALTFEDALIHCSLISATE